MTSHGFTAYLISILYAVVGGLLIGIGDASAIGGGISWLIFSGFFLWEALATVPAS